ACANGGRAGQKLRCLAQLGNCHIRRSGPAEAAQIEHRINDLIAAAGAAPGHRQNVVVHNDGVVGGIVIAVQSGAVVDDVVGGIEARTNRRVGQGDAVVAPIEGGDLGGGAAAVFFGDVDDGVVEKCDAPAAIAGAGAVAFVEEDVVHVVEEIVEDGPVGVLANEIDPAGDGAGGIQGVIGTGRIAMDVHEDIPFDPGVGGVEVEAIVGSAIEDVVDELEDGARAIAASEINGVVEAPGVAEIVIAEDAIAASGNAVDAVEGFGAGGTGISWE